MQIILGSVKISIGNYLIIFPDEWSMGVFFGTTRSQFEDVGVREKPDPLAWWTVVEWL